MSPRALDLFAGDGGAGEGYRRAGFTVVGIDNEPHPYPPGDFIQADAMQVLAATSFLDGFDFVHVSPPCPRYSSVTPEDARDDHPDLVSPVRELLREWGGMYVIENVPRSPLIEPLLLCGTEFGLGAHCHDGRYRQLQRHRLFESNVWLMGAGGCRHRGQPVGVYGTGGGGQQTRGYKATRAEAREAMGIDWMRHEDIVQAIPPAYTEHIGLQVMQRLMSAAA